MVGETERVRIVGSARVQSADQAVPQNRNRQPSERSREPGGGAGRNAEMLTTEDPVNFLAPDRSLGGAASVYTVGGQR